MASPLNVPLASGLNEMSKRTASPVGVENVEGSAPVAPMSPENDQEDGPPQKKRKVSHKRISYARKKMLASSALYRALSHEGPMTGDLYPGHRRDSRNYPAVPKSDKR
jgi:hypothetical protein